MTSKKSQFRNVFYAGYKNKSRPWGVRIHVRNAPSGKDFVNLGYYADDEEAARVADVGLVIIEKLINKHDLLKSPEAAERLNFDGKPPLSMPAAWILDEIHRRLIAR